MRRKLLKILSLLLLFLIILFGIFGIWTWYQMNMGQYLQTGEVQPSSALGGVVIPETAVLYGLLAGFFILLTIVCIWFTYRLVMFPALDEAVDTAADE